MYEFINSDYKIFKSYKNTDLDLILLKDNFTFGILFRKNNKIKEEEILEVYDKEITKLINIDLHYNVIRELWIVQRHQVFKLDVTTKKIICESL